MTTREISLIEAAFTAPLIGFNPRARRRVLHAVEMESLMASWTTRQTVDAVCGAKRLKLMEDGLFPPRVASLPERYERCRDCHALTGKKRPRCQLVSGAEEPR